ncbi:MAG: transporter [Planctomycetaceae bacterium]
MLVIPTNQNRPLLSRLLALLLVMLPAISAAAEQDKSAYGLLRPTPRGLLRPMSTDRPDATESPYTVDAGRAQIELEVVSYLTDRRNPERSATRVRELSLLGTNVKVGVSDGVDVQLLLLPHALVRTDDLATGATMESQGFGDVGLRVKINFWGNDGGETALAALPFVTFPTAEGGLGSGDLEGGVAFPLAVALGGEFGLGAMLQFAAVRDAADAAYVLEFVHTTTVSRAIAGDLSGFLEIAGALTTESGSRWEATLNFGLTYAATEDLLFDIGANLGLTRAAPDVRLFFGVSRRF